MVALHLDKNGVLGLTNHVASMYGRKKFQNFVAVARAAGNVLYERKGKDLNWLPVNGLQLPEMEAKTDPININLSQTAEGVKANFGAAIGAAIGAGLLGGDISIPNAEVNNAGRTGPHVANPSMQSMTDAQGGTRLSRRTQRVLGALGDRLGVSIVVDATGGGNNGYYDAGSRTIHLSADAVDPLGVVLSHEITHRLKEASPSEYLAFARMAQEQLRAAEKYDSMALRVRDAYGELSSDALADEMTAHYAQSLVTDIGEFERLAGVNRSLAQQLLDWLDKFLHKARLSLQGLSPQEQNEIFKDFTFHEVEAARKAWAEALRRADAGAKGQVGTHFHIAWNAEADIDRVLNGERLRTQVRLRDYTPTALVDRGIPDLPMYMNAAHIRENILSEDEARAKGLPTRRNINYHGLGKELFLKAVDAMDGPIEVFQWRKNPYNHYGPNDYIVITQVSDQSGNRIVVPIVINSIAKENHAYIDANEVKSVYGKDELKKYLARYTRNQSLSRVKEKRSSSTEARVQYPRVGEEASLNNPRVAQSDPGVNPDSMQDGKQYSRQLGPEEAQIKRNRQMARQILKALGSKTDIGDAAAEIDAMQGLRGTGTRTTALALKHEEHRSAIEQNAEAAVRQAYISKMLTEKRLLQQLWAAKATGVPDDQIDAYLLALGFDPRQFQ